MALTKVTYAMIDKAPVNVYDYGAAGDNATDDSAAFQAAITQCESTGQPLYIPEGQFVFDSQLTVSERFDIFCAKTAMMRWTSSVEAECGILFDFETSGNNQLCEINLPSLFSSAINSSFQIPGYGPSTYTYNLSSRAGNGITLKGGNRIDLNVHYLTGWESGILVQSTPTATVANVNINVNTADFNVKGIAVFSPTSSSDLVQALSYTVNTSWAKYPIFISTSNLSCIASEFTVTGQAITNETGGCIIYHAGTASNALDTCQFNVNWAFAGYGLDSTTGVSTSLICPFIGGDGSSNGSTTDGNSPDVAYFKGNYCQLSVGPVMGVGGGVAGASPVPEAGDTIRVRDAGLYNLIRMKNTDNIANTPIAVTATVGEANYNGGVGGAQYSNKVYCTASVPILAALNGTTFYMYHQCISADQTKPIKTYPKDSSLIAKDLQMFAATDTGTNNRQIKIEVYNMSTTTPTAATTINFWVELP